MAGEKPTSLITVPIFTEKIPVSEVEALQNLVVSHVAPKASFKKQDETKGRQFFVFSDRADPYESQPNGVDIILTVSLGDLALGGQSLYISYFKQQFSEDKKHRLKRDVYRFKWQGDRVMSADILTTTHRFTKADFVIDENGVQVEIMRPVRSDDRQVVRVSDCNDIADRMLSLVYKFETGVA